MRALVGPLRTARNPQHRTMFVQGGNSAHQLQMPLPCLHSARRQDHHIVGTRAKLRANLHSRLSCLRGGADRAVNDSVRHVWLQKRCSRCRPSAVTDDEIGARRAARAFEERRASRAVVLPQNRRYAAAASDTTKDRMRPRSMTDDRSVGSTTEQAAELMSCAKNRRRVAETNVAKEMHPRIAVAKLREQARIGSYEELERRACTLGERREHPLDASEQPTVGDVKNCHRRLMETRSYLMNCRLITPRERRRERAQRSEPHERPAFAPKALRRGLAVAFSGGGSEPSKRLARERVAESEG